MRIFRGVLVAVVALLFVVPVPAAAAETTFFGPIIPPECHCEDVRGPDGLVVDSAPQWGCVLAVIGNLTNFAVSVGVIIFILVVLYAGILFMASPLKAENRELGRSIMMNAFVGMAIVLSAWIFIDFIMKTVYKGEDGNAEFGPWNSILSGNRESYCLLPQGTPRESNNGNGSGNTNNSTGNNNGNSQTVTPVDSDDIGPNGNWTTFFAFDNSTLTGDVRQQIGHRSAPLNSLLSCMAGNLPSGVGRISSISDKRIVAGTHTFAGCAASGSCGHTRNSCHYGGSRPEYNGESYAVDFGDEQNSGQLESVARACAEARNIPDIGFVRHSDHLHISVDRETIECDQSASD